MALVDRATGDRHPVVERPVLVPRSAADDVAVVHASVARQPGSTQSAGGGVHRDAALACTAAVAEAIERWAATQADLVLSRASETRVAASLRLAEFTLHSDDQRLDCQFPHTNAYPGDEWLTEVFWLDTNEPVWVPAALVSLTERFGALATSSGLAADPSVVTALLRATQELIERDAYMSTWLHQLGGLETPVDRLAVPEGGEVRVFDLTPAYSSHPVACVAGTALLAGRPRHSLGLACRATWDDAVDKAYAEFLQGTMFVGHQLAINPAVSGLDPTAVRDFDAHAVFYGANPHWWPHVPMLRAARPALAPPDAPTSNVGSGVQLAELVTRLAAADIRLAYRELSSVECDQLGLRVVRVLSPDLTPLHHDHLWPYLGGTTCDVARRYSHFAERQAGPFPSPYPHPLG